jgi:hypothetical protein
VRINQGYVVASNVRWSFCAILPIFALVCFEKFSQIPAIISVVLLFSIVLLIWSMSNVLEIDPTQKKVTEYTEILGSHFFKEVTRFQYIEKIYINCNVKKEVVHRDSGKYIGAQYTEYQAYIKLLPEDKFFLQRNKNIEELESQIAAIATELETVVVRNF